jgi:ribosomal protein S18 acetylase RimI-like enzyme
MKKTSVRPAKKTKTNASPRGGARPKSAGAEEGAEPMLDEPAKKPTKKPATSGPKRPAKKAARPAAKTVKRESELPDEPVPAGSLSVRRMHRRDLNRVWEFLKLVFRDVNRETVEYQRPRSKQRFSESYDDEGIEQLLFEAGDEIVGYAECAHEATGSDNWINPRYFESRDMRPLYVEELASHPSYQGRGVGTFMLEQLEHLARVRGCTHLVLEVAENNRNALGFYRKRSFYRLDAAIFMAKKVEVEPELLPPRPLQELGRRQGDEEGSEQES